MNMFDILEKKRNKLSLTEEEINFVITNYLNEKIPDYQMAALLMAIVINGMDDNEIKWLTMAMAKSGDILDLSNINGIIVDKHSTGGIGDKTTLIVGPILAALDCKVAKMSGRSLGYTGGTIDKLESIGGFKTNLTEEEFIKQVNNINISIIGQTKNIAPADKKLYALRDVTATVDSIPLIAASIMSKKIASGAPNLVLDIKVGSGAFMKDIENGRLLAQKMVAIGTSVGINVIAIITNMDVPLGNKIGNLLEVQEAIDILKGNGPEDLKELCLFLAAYMYSISTNTNLEDSKLKVKEIINSGKAYDKFKEFIEYQGGSLDCVFNTPKYEYKVISDKEGYINHMNSENIGKISNLLGAGRKAKADRIDYMAGIKINKKSGDYVEKGDLLAILYSSSQKDFKELATNYIKSLVVDNIKVDTKKIIIDVIN